MSVDFVLPIDIYTAVGGEPSFTYTFPLGIPIAPAAHEIVVKKKTGDVITDLTEGVDFTVTGAGNPLGGTIVLDTGVFPAGAVAADVFTLYRQTVVARASVSDFQIAGDFFAVTVNAQLDHIISIAQDTNLQINQAITLPIGTGLSGLTFPLPIADGYIKWNASKTALEAATVVLVGTATGVDETDTDPTKDKMGSNLLAKGWEDTKQAVNGVQVGSAVNRFQATNSATGNPVILEAIGTDANVGVDIKAKGDSNFRVFVNGGVALDVTQSGVTPVNGITIRARETAQAPAIEAFGSDANVSIKLTPKGTGDVEITSGNLIVGGGVINIPSGTVVPYVGTTAPAGWIALNGGTIGDAGSGASNRANADTVTLYTLFWNSMADAQAPVSTGRGASAAADFAAGKTITVSDLRGKAPFGTGGAGALVLHGDNGGAERVTLVVTELPVHAHVETGYVGGGGAINGILRSNSQSGTAVNASHSTANAGSGASHENLPPWVTLTYICKL